MHNLTSLDGKSATTSRIHNINGSFLHFDEERGGKILDLSKKMLRSPRNIIVGEKSNHQGTALNQREPWNAQISIQSSASKSKMAGRGGP